MALKIWLQCVIPFYKYLLMLYECIRNILLCDMNVFMDFYKHGINRKCDRNCLLILKWFIAVYILYLKTVVQTVDVCDYTVVHVDTGPRISPSSLYLQQGPGAGTNLSGSTKLTSAWTLGCCPFNNLCPLLLRRPTAWGCVMAEASIPPWAGVWFLHIFPVTKQGRESLKY